MSADRRSFVQLLAAVGLLHLTRGLTHHSPEPRFMPLPRSDWRSQFPSLNQTINGHPLAYLDTAATAQRPRAVSQAVIDFYERDNSNPGRTLHTLARRAEADYENARKAVARFVNAPDPLEIIFTRGTTEGINLVASSWGAENLHAGDEVLLTISEHASSMLPWQIAAQRAGAVVRYLDIESTGQLRLDQLDGLITRRTKVLSFMHVSNVLGLINPAKELCARARAAGIVSVVDAAQSAPHMPIDIQDIGCDFLAFSGHKLMGPMGTGVLYGRRELLDAMPPYQSGSNMAHEVGVDSLEYSAGALKFGAGTPNVSGPVGLAAAIDFIGSLGFDAIRRHEAMLVRHALERLTRIPGLRILGSTIPTDRIGVFSFTMKAAEPARILSELDARGIAIRAGDLASLPLLERLGTRRAARASVYLYNTMEEIDRLADGLTAIR
ncbi:MAG TPA: aminotransferase class V-fold PLP-dependent enzyme [Gemmatimonadaceae bacterium]|nr:aminotransferase class V-fold PLP-dependent enzyme [Gemmatimonadaceae bacterium]